MTSLPTYTWDQAFILGLATARGFRAVGVRPATVRKWASRGSIHAVGKAPGGAHLYRIDDVTRHAQQRAIAAKHGAVSHLDADGRPMPHGRSSFAYLKLSVAADTVETC